MTIPHYVLCVSALLILNEKTVLGRNLNVSFTETDDCECGFFNHFGVRIVGGRETKPNEYPWMVAILYNKKMHCGGSLINDRYILTAGHCLKWANKRKLTVVLGMHDRNLFENTNSGGLAVEVEDTIVHENFTSYAKYDVHDIALIKLKYPVQFNEKILPICLSTSTDESYSNETAQVTGWGRISEKETPSRFLKVADIFVINNKDCMKIPPVGQFVIDSMLCGYNEGVDACQGDSGGPLTYEMDSGRMEQIGVVSWGIGCARPGLPGIYVRVTSYIPWIASKTADAVYCNGSY